MTFLFYELFFIDKNNLICYSFFKLDAANHLERGVFLFFVVNDN